MTTTLTRAEAATFGAYAAQDEAGGVAYRFDTSTGIALAKGDERVLTGVEVLKVGTFTGSIGGEVIVDESELDALVARFVELRDSDTFVPPFRIDHSWSVMGVVGWFTELRVEQRADPSDAGIVKPYLVGDVLLNATDAAEVRAHIAGGKFRNRSSELWPYRANNGREYPMIFAGCGFVDIPAVEGLAAIQLRRGTPDGHTGGSKMSKPEDGAAPEGTPTDPTADEQAAEQAAPAADAELERGVDVDKEAAAGADDKDKEAAPGDLAPGTVADALAGEDDPTKEWAERTGAGKEDTPPAEQAGATDLRMRQGETAAAFATRVQAHVDQQVALRVEQGERLARFRSSGKVVPATEAAITALLSHPDKSVRDHAADLLDKIPEPIKLGNATPAPRGTGATTPDQGVTAVELRELRGDEFAKAWAQLTPEQRKADDFLEAYSLALGTRPVVTVGPR